MERERARFPELRGGHLGAAIGLRSNRARRQTLAKALRLEMREITHSVLQQIRVSATLDVQAVEQELDELWKQHTGETNVEENGAVMRARVLNLLVYVASEAALEEVNELLGEITSVHPCRVIV